jgi:hypothetical protein
MPDVNLPLSGAFTAAQIARTICLASNRACTLVD